MLKEAAIKLKIHIPKDLSLRLSIHRYIDSAEIQAHASSKKVGQANLVLNEEKWNVSAFYVDRSYSASDMVRSRLLSAIDTFSNTADKSLTYITPYLEKDD